jgi:hypothetical protein
MSDPLTEEERELQLESHWDRPEGSVQETAHQEGDGDVVVEQQPDHASVDAASAESTSDLEHGVTVNTVDDDASDRPRESHSEAQPGADSSALSCTNSASDSQEQESSEEFDYLAYAQERAMFFWGDCIQMGLIKEEELPKELIEKVKIVPC